MKMGHKQGEIYWEEVFGKLEYDEECQQWNGDTYMQWAGERKKIPLSIEIAEDGEIRQIQRDAYAEYKGIRSSIGMLLERAVREYLEDYLEHLNDGKVLPAVLENYPDFSVERELEHLVDVGFMAVPTKAFTGNVSDREVVVGFFLPWLLGAMLLVHVINGRVEKIYMDEDCLSAGNIEDAAGEIGLILEDVMREEERNALFDENDNYLEDYSNSDKLASRQNNIPAQEESTLGIAIALVVMTVFLLGILSIVLMVTYLAQGEFQQALPCLGATVLFVVIFFVCKSIMKVHKGK